MNEFSRMTGQAMVRRIGIGACMTLGLIAFSWHARASDDQSDFFESRIRPRLIEHCYPCHSIDSKPVQGNLRLDTAEGLIQGGDSGPALIANDAQASLLIQALSYSDIQMPPKGRLPQPIIDDFVQWIEQGAWDSRTEPESVSPSMAREPNKPLEPGDHWAIQPRVQPNRQSAELPTGPDTELDHPIDLMIAAEQHRMGLTSAPLADRYTLIRRLSFDLRGLPPEVEEIESFVADEDPLAIERVIDRFMSSPAFGERWGRHWLDLARYADSNGADENHAYPVAWRYRDFVVAAFNRDTPYDQFTRQQLAGDLLPADSESERRENLIATGFLVIGPKMLAEQDKPKMVADIVDEQLDTVGATFLGMTFGCARCHDHKFDPITAEDYYGLAGIFHSTQSMANLDFVSKWNEVDLPDQRRANEIEAYQPLIEAAKEKSMAVKAEIGKPESEWSEEDRRRVGESVKALEEIEKARPVFDRAMVVSEAALKTVPLAKRGNHLQPMGEPIARRFPLALNHWPNEHEFAAESSGRLQLAHWLVDARNPLTARVIANRIWAKLFGTGLVKSASNFGWTAEPPSHPELLDWLADELVRNDWSIKKLQRSILLSRTYQMAWRRDSASETIDPENRFHWRHARRRLEVEPLRDALLVVGDQLDRQLGGQAQAIYGDQFEGSRQPKTLHDASRRTLYLPINRAALHELFSTFDYVDSSVSIGQRASTTVPHQGLFLMNSPFAMEQAHRLANQTFPGDHAASRQEVSQALSIVYLRTLGRPPRPSESAAAEQWLQTQTTFPKTTLEPIPIGIEPWTAICRALISTHEFMTVD